MNLRNNMMFDNFIPPMKNNNNNMIQYGPLMNNNYSPMNINYNSINNDSMVNNNMTIHRMECSGCFGQRQFKIEESVLNYIRFLEGQIITISQKLNQSSSSASFPFVFNDIISELERVIASQCPAIYWSEGIFNVSNGGPKPDYERSKLVMESFLLRIKEFAFETENNAIVKKIEKKVSTYLNIKEDIEYKTAGNFLYFVGGIARKALEVSNKIYDEYFKSYTEYMKKHNFGFVYTSKAKDFPEYMKNFLNDEFYNITFKLSKDNIQKYVDQSDPNFSFELFHDFLNFYLRWNFSCPQLQIHFMDYTKGKEFDNENME